MARNYIQDITPQGEEPEPKPQREKAPLEERSIRDFKPSAARVRLQTPPPRLADVRQEYAAEAVPKKGARWGVWIAALIALIVLVGVAVLILLPSTTITIVPRSHVMPFDATSPLTAYPAASAATGTIPYTIVTQVFEDSTVVAASGTERAEEKATGTVTVYNEYSDQPVRLIKNTRFQSPTGLVYRIPASVDVPGKTAAAPGTITITVFADQTGPSYNIGPTDKFTLPGLKSSAEMYEKVYAKSTQAFSGGFSGERPAVSQSVLDASKTEVRGRLNEKARQLAQTAPNGTIAFPGLMAVSFETLPPTNEAGGGVRIVERATVTMPTFQADSFARSIAQAVSADAEGQMVAISFANDVSAQPVSELMVADLGQQPITFTINGRGQLTWSVDTMALAEALAGREESAFETIIQGFPAVEEARARITPFWKHAFPQSPAKIKVMVEEPQAQF